MPYVEMEGNAQDRMYAYCIDGRPCQDRNEDIMNISICVWKIRG